MSPVTSRLPVTTTSPWKVFTPTNLVSPTTCSARSCGLVVPIPRVPPIYASLLTPATWKTCPTVPVDCPKPLPTKSESLKVTIPPALTCL